MLCLSYCTFPVSRCTSSAHRDAERMVITNDHSNSTTSVVYYQAKANITSEALGHNVSAEASEFLSTFSYA
jgi:hypothetical protein